MWGAILAALAGVLAALQLRQSNLLKKRLRQTEEDVMFIAEERRSERAGRTKAERQLRQLQLKLSQLQGGAHEEGPKPGTDGEGPGPALDLQQVPFPMRPIGILRSCFGKRNGTPRQPLLVPAARAMLTLRPELDSVFLEGLQQYSHCWVLYVFHMNTDLQRLWKSEGGGAKGKIRVPRLDGGKLGVFATRSPHRPCPIGLSVAEVLSVEGRVLILGGADIVDGSPVLDIKPYVPFCDSVLQAAAPDWVAARAEQEPLDIGSIHIPEVVEAQLQSCWQRVAAGEGPGRRGSLYSCFEDFMELIVQVLSRDIRSVTQRVKVPLRVQKGQEALTLQGTDNWGVAAAGAGGSAGATDSSAPAAAEGSASSGAATEGKWQLVLDGIDIRYDVEDSDDSVLLRTAAVLAA